MAAAQPFIASGRSLHFPFEFYPGLQGSEFLGSIICSLGPSYVGLLCFLVHQAPHHLGPLCFTLPGMLSLQIFLPWLLCLELSSKATSVSLVTPFLPPI